jgi:circadian clock protein KaiC
MTVGDNRLSTGVDGLDEVCLGGLRPGRVYAVRGDPGAGKTILGYHWLTADPDADALFVAFEEREADVRRNAAELGFDLSDVEVLDLSPADERFFEDDAYTVFTPDEVEQPTVTGQLAGALADDPPARVFVDPLSELRALSPDDHQFRRRTAALFGHLRREGVTVLFTTQPTHDAPDDDLAFLADGSLDLRRSETGRTIEVTKFRGSDFRTGRHTLRIADTGLAVYPRLRPDSHEAAYDYGRLASGVSGLDDLLGGGIERGTVTVVSGPTGVGKSTTATQFLLAAAEQGDRAVGYLFEESVASLRHRSASIGTPLADVLESGDLQLQAVEPLALSPDEFAARVREEVEERDATVVLIDGTAGYRLSLQDEREDVVAELHALCRYLRNVGVTVLLTEEVTTVTGPFSATEERVSYLADTLVFLRYVEVCGEMRKAIGVLKKRLGDFEPTLRRLRITEQGLRVGDPMSDLHGVLTGTPEVRE